MVMDQGRIVERGTHAELLALNNHYASLHAMQFNDAGVSEDAAEPDPALAQESFTRLK